MDAFDHACSAARALRNELSRIPEISFEERRTSRALAAWFREGGLAPVTGVGRTGLLVEVRAERPGPARLFRADIDAIGHEPAFEVALAPQTPKAAVPRDGGDDVTDSESPSAHHACGHDGHSAMLAGGLLALARAPERWSGSVTGVFQPAEEIGRGAEEMLAHEALAAATFDNAYALHNLPGMPLGKVGIADGVAALASTGLVVKLEGRTTHASTPHKGNAAVSAMATFVGELLALPSHVIPFGRSVLITPTYLDAGTRQFGRVPPQAELGVVLRSSDDGCLAELLEQAQRRLDALAHSYGMRGTLEQVEPFPVTLNDAEAVAEVRQLLDRAGFELEVRSDPEPWSEDFGFFLQRWPGALMLLGAGEEHPTLHAADYEFPDELIEPGVRLWTALAGWS